MKLNKVEIEAFFRDPDALALVVLGRDLFGLLSRTVKLPPMVAALAAREAGDRVLVPPGSELAGDDVAEVMLFRTSPLELSFHRDGLTTKDNYLCQARVTMHVTAIPEHSDAESFRRAVLGSRRDVRASDIAQRLEPQVAQVLAGLAEQHEVEDLADGRCRDQTVQAVGKPWPRHASKRA